MGWFGRKRKFNYNELPVVVVGHDETRSMEYYGIEVKHSDFSEWYYWSKLYSGSSQAKSARQDIIKGNQRLVDEGSEWRIFKLIRENK